MLNIYFGEWDYEDERYIWNMNAYFDGNYETDWINNEITKKIIKDIDGCSVIGDHLIESPIFGMIPPSMLSGGAKLLITINIERNLNIYNGTKCGPNCSDWLLYLSKDRDIIISRNYDIEFSKEPFMVRVLNDNSIITTNKELLYKYIEYVK